MNLDCIFQMVLSDFVYGHPIIRNNHRKSQATISTHSAWQLTSMRNLVQGACQKSLFTSLVFIDTWQTSRSYRKLPSVQISFAKNLDQARLREVITKRFHALRTGVGVHRVAPSASGSVACRRWSLYE